MFGGCGVELGITLDFGQDGDRLDERFGRFQPLIEAAERAGFALLSTGEQHPTSADYFHLPAPLTALAAFAGRTTMRLGTGVLLLTAWNPVRLAYDAAVLDQLSGGRLTLGVAAGNPATWARFGVSAERLADRLDQTVCAVKAAWSDDAYHGDLVACEGPLRPLPQQAGGPPLIIGGLAGRAVRRAAELGDGWFAATNYQFERQITPTIARYRARCQQANRTPGAIMANRLAVVVDSPAELADAAQPAIELLRFYASFGTVRRADGNPVAPADISLGSALLRDLALVGTAADVAEQLAAYQQAGVTHLQLRIQPAGVTADAALRTVQALAAR
jgi:alkanesulfonate monooxygenase SsuD/methylene tetrahydromethanopterin reductase-like flavin-dependent oxidoreductase (luciferase family)